MAKHLELNDRITIQSGLKEGKGISAIAGELNRDKATISREIRSKRLYIDFKDFPSIQARNACINRYHCKIKDLCKSPTCFKRNKNCRLCGQCIFFCELFKEEKCPKHETPPYVCNGCKKKPRCTLGKWLYDAKKAQSKYEHDLSESRKGLGLNPAELKALDDIVSPLLKNGQSIRHICNNKSDEIMVSDKTIYNYVGKRMLSADKFDLGRTIQRKVFKKSGPPVMIDRKCREGRTYDDFNKFIEIHQDVPVVEMDTVEGKRGGKVILTLFFRNCGLQLGFLRNRNTAASVTAIFRQLKTLLDEDFKILFPVILTDRGSEFSNPFEIEVDFETGEVVSNVFYCDPQNINQKSRCERNHEFIRMVIPKGKSFDHLEQKHITLMMNHINSYGRESLNKKAPLELFENIYGSEIAKKLCLKIIHHDDIVLKPKLLK